MNSYELAVECHRNGLLSDEGLADVLQMRRTIVKEAMVKAAISIPWEKMRDAAGRIKSGAGTALSGPIGSLAKLVALGGIISSGAMGAQAIMRHSKEKGLKRDIQASYQQMFDDYPKLHDLDRSKVRRTFGVMARYAPSLAADPMVAGAWVQANTTMAFIEPAAVKALAETQSQIDRVQEKRNLLQPGVLTTGLGLAGKAIGHASGHGGAYTQSE